jgi:hypothetical protein
MTIDTMPTMTPPRSSGRSKRMFKAIAPPITSARSVAAATSSACAQYSNRPARGMRSPSSSGRLFPVTNPSFADRYCTTTANTFAATSTHTSRYPYSAPAERLAATFPGSTYAIAATNAGPRSQMSRRSAGRAFTVCRSTTGVHSEISRRRAVVGRSIGASCGPCGRRR